jgi:adenine-specific DNA-methyltransferase
VDGPKRRKIVIKTTTYDRFPTDFVDRVVLGDCVEHMARMPTGSVDLIITDPPYIARYRDRSGRALTNDDNASWVRPAFAEAYRVLRPGRFMVSFYGWPKADYFLAAWRAVGFRPVGHFVGVKRYVSRKRFVQYQHEMAYLLAKGDPVVPREPISDVLPWDYTGNRWHPTEKPISALRPLVRGFSDPGELVLDPFAGSATTLVAAALEQRHACGIELDPDYFARGRQRLTAFETAHGPQRVEKPATDSPAA